MIAADRRRAPLVVAALAVPVFLGTMFLTVANGSFAEDATFIVVAVLMIIGYATVGAVIASRRVGGPIGWLMLVIGLTFLGSAATSEWVIYSVRTRPGSLPLTSVAAWLNGWLFIPGIAPVILVLLLFPTGRVPTARWRALPAIVVALAALGTVATMLQPGRLDIARGVNISNPTGVPALRGFTEFTVGIAGIGVIAATVTAVGALVLRYRRSRGEERQQIRWLAYVAAAGLLLFALALVSSIGARPNDDRPITNVLYLAFFVCLGLGIPAAAGVAILRYRLWDLDLVVRKAVIFALVAGAITVLALVAVVLIPILVVGIGMTGWDRGVLVIGVALGLLVGPLRRWGRGVADRMVYGGRATPYEVLTEFSTRLADTYSADDVLPRMAAIVGSGTGAAAATVWLRVGRDLRPVASWPPGSGATGEDAGWFEVRHHGDALGAITVSMPANDPMTPTKERLVRDLAAQAGLVLRNVRLIEELRESRRRIVAAQDTRARALERNIHDGAQQQLVALAVKLRLLDGTIDRDPPGAHAMLAQVQTDAQDALDTLRDLARGIYPPLLADKGLQAALEAQASKSAIPTRVLADGVVRYGQDVEAAVYFCALEALQNAAKYSGATGVDLSLTASDAELRFEIRDDGTGFDAETVVRGVGLEGMADRIDAIGGVLTIESAPGRGTRIAGSIPIDGRPGRLERGTDQPDDSEPVAASQADSSRSGPNTALGM